MTSYYFTGTRSQLLEKLESFDKQADFREDELTFKIDVTDLGSGAEASDEVEKLESEPETFDTETVEPAKGETEDRGTSGETAKSTTDTKKK